MSAFPILEIIIFHESVIFAPGMLFHNEETTLVENCPWGMRNPLAALTFRKSSRCSYRDRPILQYF